MKYLILQAVDPIVSLAYICSIVSVMFGWDILKAKDKTSIVFGKYPLFFFAAGSVFSIAVNLFQAEAIKVAPNPGYVSAVDASSGALVALAAAWLFKDHLSAIKLIGITGAIISLAVLLI